MQKVTLMTKSIIRLKELCPHGGVDPPSIPSGDAGDSNPFKSVQIRSNALQQRSNALQIELNLQRFCNALQNFYAVSIYIVYNYSESKIC